MLPHGWPVHPRFTHALSGSHVMMAATEIENNLRFLHESLTGDAAKQDQASSVVTDLSRICIQETTDKEIGR